jgi:hypothetical protein
MGGRASAPRNRRGAGGGYTKSNVARCWANETAALVGRAVPEELPANTYLEYYGPDHRLNLHARKAMDNGNARAELERIRREVLENLRHLAHAPSALPGPSARRARAAPRRRPAPARLCRQRACLACGRVPAGSRAVCAAGQACPVRAPSLRGSADACPDRHGGLRKFAASRMLITCTLPGIANQGAGRAAGCCWGRSMRGEAGPALALFQACTFTPTPTMPMTRPGSWPATQASS